MADIKMGLSAAEALQIAHFPSSSSGGATFVAVCDVDVNQAQSSAAKWGAEEWFTDYRVMLTRRTSTRLLLRP